MYDILFPEDPAWVVKGQKISWIYIVNPVYHGDREGEMVLSPLPV